MKKFCVVLLAVMFVGAAVVSAAPQPFTDNAKSDANRIAFKDLKPAADLARVKVLTQDQRTALRSTGAGSVAAYGDTYGIGMLLWGLQYGFYGNSDGPTILTYDGAATGIGSDVFTTVSMIGYDFEIDNMDGTFEAFIGMQAIDGVSPIFPCFTYSGDNITDLELDIGAGYAPGDPWSPFGIFHVNYGYWLFNDSLGIAWGFYVHPPEKNVFGVTEAWYCSYSCGYGLVGSEYEWNVEEAPPIPTLGVWGPIALAIPLLIGGAVLFRRRPA